VDQRRPKRCPFLTLINDDQLLLPTVAVDVSRVRPQPLGWLPWPRPPSLVLGLCAFASVERRSSYCVWPSYRECSLLAVRLLRAAAMAAAAAAVGTMASPLRCR
jgi:hypothetical protein